MKHWVVAGFRGGLGGPTSMGVLVLGLMVSGGGCGGGHRDEEALHAEALTPPTQGHDRRARLDQAMHGLHYSEEWVLVNQALARPLEDRVAARAALARGDDWLARGDRVEAVAAYTRAVIETPRAVMPYLKLGRLLIRVGRLPEAHAAARTALAIDETRADTHHLLGTIHEHRGDRAAARASYQDALTHEPLHGAAHARLAALEYLLGSTAAARRHYEVAQAVRAAVPSRLPGLLVGSTMPVAVVRPMVVGSASPTIGAQRRIDNGGGTAPSNEISVVAALSAPGVLVAAWNDFRAPVRVGVGVSLDGGVSWTDTVLRPPPTNQTELEGDPMTAHDPRTGDIWVGGISADEEGGVFVARKNPGLVTFRPSVMTFVGSGVDKPWMVAGRPPSTPAATHLYVAFNFGLQTSTDLGETWGAPVLLEPGIGYLPRVGPDGTLYVAVSDFETVRVQASFDGGATVEPPMLAATRMEIYDPFTAVQIPGTFRVAPFNYLAIDPDRGRLYFMWFDTTSVSGGETEVDLYLTHSDDAGTTWATPSVLALPGDQFFPWLEVDASGRLHVVFLDTRNTVQLDSDTVAWLDAYYAYSEDGGATWAEARLTPTSWSTALADPMSPPFEGQFIGDYLGLAVSGDRIYPVYPSTQHGDLDLFSHIITFPVAGPFVDGFESGDVTAWDSVVP